ncbi:MAG: MucR family transcriptional regulator [Hyphomonadaceae bacterium]|nr:MucR family transcriptional regulator [Hyphomonadaceae bacterium]GIK50670.1 MAG: transcriptional regulator [Alphaproteobacteria bacterium]
MRNDDEVAEGGGDAALRMTTDIVASFVANNKLSSDELADLIRSVHRTLRSLNGDGGERISERPKPAAPINKSVQQDYIICLEDGKKLKMLKRYLRSTYNMSPDEYRKRWGLPPDYPMVAPSYAARRSEFAKKIGLGKGVRRRD